ncbi:hypothetical protein CDAR_319071 [Caerostris darwini]|uniref:Uncharacterized protein n=1 Tax=Caerostris darwini TaxID=1538125 RepID=A0AAV4TYN2_9ARAC|nr:hypothetical protein CDAR_319071 [Caerostris darwini]
MNIGLASVASDVCPLLFLERVQSLFNSVECSAPWNDDCTRGGSLLRVEESGKKFGFLIQSMHGLKSAPLTRCATSRFMFSIDE